MPFSPAFTRVLQAREHGWQPKKGSLKKISPDKAKSMLSEAKRAGQAKALKEA
jgi:hypothetical protein